MGFMDQAGRGQEKADFGMTFNAGDRLDGDSLLHGHLLGAETGVQMQIGDPAFNQRGEEGEKSVG